MGRGQSTLARAIVNRILIIRPDAEADIADAQAWYDRQRTGLGDEFLLCLEETLDRLQRLPEAGEPLGNNARRSLVHRFPYAVYYRVGDDHIAVLGVFHNRRDPRRWRARLS